MVERRNRIAAAVCDFCRSGALLLFRFHDRCDISTFWLAWTLGLQRCFHTAHQYGGVARHVVRLVDSDVELVDTAFSHSDGVVARADNVHARCGVVRDAAPGWLTFEYTKTRPYCAKQ